MLGPGCLSSCILLSGARTLLLQFVLLVLLLVPVTISFSPGFSNLRPKSLLIPGDGLDMNGVDGSPLTFWDERKMKRKNRRNIHIDPTFYRMGIANRANTILHLAEEGIDAEGKIPISTGKPTPIPTPTSDNNDAGMNEEIEKRNPTSSILRFEKGAASAERTEMKQKNEKTSEVAVVKEDDPIPAKEPTSSSDSTVKVEEKEDGESTISIASSEQGDVKGQQKNIDESDKGLEAEAEMETDPNPAKEQSASSSDSNSSAVEEEDAGDSTNEISSMEDEEGGGKQGDSEGSEEVSEVKVEDDPSPVELSNPPSNSDGDGVAGSEEEEEETDLTISSTSGAEDKEKGDKKDSKAKSLFFLDPNEEDDSKDEVDQDSVKNTVLDEAEAVVQPTNETKVHDEDEVVEVTIDNKVEEEGGVEEEVEVENPPKQSSTVLNEPTAISSSNAIQESDDTAAKDARNEFLEAVRGAAVDASLGIFRALRMKAAETLTESLPNETRKDLLQRLGNDGDEGEKTMSKGRDDSGAEVRSEGYGDSSTHDSTTLKTEEITEEIVERGSVQEETAAAMADEARFNKEKWEREKEQIVKQMEEAANERVKNELKIQQQRMDQEQKEMKKAMSMEIEIEASIRKQLQEQQQKEREEMERLLAVKEQQRMQELEQKLRAEQEEKEKIAEVTLQREMGKVERLENLLKEMEDTERILMEEKRKLEGQLMSNAQGGGSTEDIDSSRKADATIAEEREKLDEVISLRMKKEHQQLELEEVQANLSKTVKKERELLSEVESLRKKREQQQSDLKEIENELRDQILAIEDKKQQISKMKEIAEAENAEDEAVSGEEDYSPEENSQEEKAELEASDDDTEQDEKDDDVHPILGPVISDLGYKRIHRVSSGRLGTIPIWKKQRTYRFSRSQAMAKDKAKTMNLGFPGIICLHEDKNGKLSILDGQHRVGMMQVLREKQNADMKKYRLRKEKADVDNSDDLPPPPPSHDEMFQSVLVEVYPQPEGQIADKHAEEVFSEINKAEPMKLVDMPGVASAADRKVISEAVTKLKSQFPKMFSTSQRCRVPNVNEDNLRNQIFGANILRKHKLTSGKKLNAWLLEQNAALGDIYVSDEEKRGYISKKAWKKASANEFYLGLESGWLYI